MIVQRFRVHCERDRTPLILKRSPPLRYPPLMLATAGLHHVTAIAADPQRNLRFYQQVLGQRLVKLTVNFDDPGSYHFYFGDATGSPGTLLTFFPWPDAAPGQRGSGETTATAFAVPRGALGWWQQRLTAANVPVDDGGAGRAGGVGGDSTSERFGDRVLSFRDPDGMALELVERTDYVASSRPRQPTTWQPAQDIPRDLAILGFHGVTLGLADLAATQELLTSILGLRVLGTERGGRVRLAAPGDGLGRIVDLERVPARRPRLGAGSVHHVAFRARDDAAQREFQSTIDAAGHGVTAIQERNYFRSIYFREPGHVLFEIATDGPGMAIDEPLDSLGTHLKLPPNLEPRRAAIEAALPAIDTLPR